MRLNLAIVCCVSGILIFQSSCGRKRGIRWIEGAVAVTPDAKSPGGGSSGNQTALPATASTSLKAFATGNRGIQIFFPPVDGATSYNVYLKNSAGVATSDTKIVNVQNGGVLQNLTANAMYYIKIASVNGSQIESVPSQTPSL